MLDIFFHMRTGSNPPYINRMNTRKLIKIQDGELSPLQQLPDLALEHIFSFLPLVDIKKMRRLSSW